MRNYKKYRSTIIELFQSFLAEEIEKRDLIFKLTEIDKQLRKNPKTLKGLWFKFFDGDTLVTTITDIENGLYFTKNNNWINEFMQIAIDKPKGLQIYYS